MSVQLNLGDVTIDVVMKDIKNIHLSVYPPVGKVRISAPQWMELDTIRVYAITKLSWIKNQQKKLQEQARETPREYLNRESHYVWGKRYLLNIIEHDSAPSIELKHSKMILQLRPDTNVEKKEEILDSWYREILKQAAEPLIAKWENLMGVKVEKLFLQRMKTKWGSCNHEAKNIRINTELAKKPPECLEYIVVHELVHLIEPTHNDRFIALMNQFMPKWRMYKDELNRLPVRHEEWGY
jgi:predicted metal-dependent hydrolase